MNRLTQTHELKTWSEYFDAVLNGKKTFEVRKNDRDFQEGDILLLNKWDKIKNEYAGSQTAFTITYVLKGGQFGIEEGYCVLGLKPILPAFDEMVDEEFDIIKCPECGGTDIIMLRVYKCTECGHQWA